MKTCIQGTSIMVSKQQLGIQCANMDLASCSNSSTFSRACP